MMGDVSTGLIWTTQGGVSMEHCDVYRYTGIHWMFGGTEREYLGSKLHDKDCERIAWRTYYVLVGPHSESECPVPRGERKPYAGG